MICAVALMLERPRLLGSIDPSRAGTGLVDWSDFRNPLLNFVSRIAGWPDSVSRPDESGKGKFLKPEEELLIPALYQWKREKDAGMDHTGLRFEKLNSGAYTLYRTDIR